MAAVLQQNIGGFTEAGSVLPSRDRQGADR
jgi:hypothetical protein